MIEFAKGRYSVRLAEDRSDIESTQRLRHLAFYGSVGLDRDEFDERCDHVLIQDRKSGSVLCCFRMLAMPDGRSIDRTYAAKFYNLDALRDFRGPMVEMGRFCIAPGLQDPDLLRLAWASMARYVDERGIELLFGCSSFQGTEADAYGDAFAILRDRHLAPKRWSPQVKAPNVVQYASDTQRNLDARQAMRSMPPLLKTYLLMGGWVSDHAVIDQQMNTMHVFTGVEISAIPPARKRLLRAISTGGA